MARGATQVVAARRRALPFSLQFPAGGGLVKALSLVAGAAIWEVLGLVLDFPWLPPLSRVVAALVELVRNGEIVSNLVVSLRTLAIGFSVSLAGGLAVGAMMGRYRRVEQALGIYVNAMLFTPSLAFAPVYFALFHLSDWTRIAVVIQFSLFFVIINTATAFRTVDHSLVEMARSFRANERQVLLSILLPASLVVVFAGIRIAMGRAIKGMISGEMFIAVVGLGGVIQRYGTQFDSARVLAVVLVTLVLALVLGTAVQVLDRRVTRWAD